MGEARDDERSEEELISAAQPPGGARDDERSEEELISAISGSWEPGWEGVAEELATNLAERADVGAACAVYHRGKPVVDVWGGLADRATGRPWERDTVTVAFSCTKGWTATLVHRAVEAGRLSLDTPVAEVWPEFAAAGKEAITLRHVLTHSAGLAVVTAELTRDEVLDWFPVVDALAAQAPLWPPGTAHGYHLRTFGWLLGEVLRRVDGRTAGRIFAEDVAAPLGLSAWIGLPAGEEPRVATLVPPGRAFADGLAALPDELLLKRATTGPSGHFGYDDRWNGRDLHAAELPSSNGITDARSLARFWAACVGDIDGVSLLDPATVAAARASQVRGPDRVLTTETHFGLGYMLPPNLSASAGPAAFGHAGAGGSLGFADPEAELGFGYVMNRLRFAPDDRRAEALVEAAYRCLGRAQRG